MKVLVVLGICLIAAVSASSLPEGRGYCCGRGIKGVAPSMWKANCVSLVEMTDILINETYQEIGEKMEVDITPEFQLQVKINSFTTATIRCIPNNAVYGYIHVMLDNLHNIIASYPTPKNALKNITETEALLVQHLHNLESALDDAGSKVDPALRTRVKEFTKATEEKAVKVFETNLKQAESNAKVFNDIGIDELLDKLVESIHKCLPIKRTDFAANFKCREDVKAVASDLRDRVRTLRIMGQVKHVSPDQSLRDLMANVIVEGRDLEELIMNDRLKRKIENK